MLNTNQSPIGQNNNGQVKDIAKIMEFANSFAPFSYKRAEQIGLAIYMVSECFDSKEPMRETMRDLVLDIIAEIHVLHGLPPFEAFMHFEVLLSRLSELLMVVRLSSETGMLSDKNSEILIKEITLFFDVLSYVREKRGSGYRTEDGRVSLSIPLQNIFNEDSSIQTQMDKTDVKSEKFKQENRKDKIDQKGHSFNKNQKDVKHDKTLKLERRNSILKVIEEKKSVTVKDVMSVIKDCSEKTIQRELVSLMKEGVLKRQGEKRWAKYSLR